MAALLGRRRRLVSHHARLRNAVTAGIRPHASRRQPPRFGSTARSRRRQLSPKRPLRRENCPRRCPRADAPPRRTSLFAGTKRVSDGTRTRGRRDHNPELYQLSYAHQDGPSIAARGAGFSPRQVTLLRSRILAVGRDEAGGRRGPALSSIRRAPSESSSEKASRGSLASSVVAPLPPAPADVSVVPPAGLKRCMLWSWPASAIAAWPSTRPRAVRRRPARRGAKPALTARAVPEDDPAVAAARHLLAQPGELPRVAPGVSELADSTCQPPTLRA